MLELLVIFFYQALPFSFALNPLPGMDLPLARVFIPIIFFVWLYKSLKNKEWFISSPAVFAGFLFWVFWASISFFWSLDSAWSVRKIIFLLNITPLFIVLLTCRGSFLKRALQAFVLGSVWISAIGAIEAGLQLFFSLEQVLTLWSENILPFFLGSSFSLAVQEYPSLLVNILGSTYLRVTAFFPDPHTLSLYLGLSIPITIAWYREKRSALRMGGFFLIIICFLLTFSRGAYLAMLLTALLASGTIFLRGGVFLKRGGYLVIGVFVIGCCVFFTPVGSRLVSSWSQTDGSRVERVRLLYEAAEHAAERPLLGVGLGNYPILVKPTAAPREPIYVHNLYLDIAVEQGIIGLLFFLSFVSGAMWRGFSIWLKEDDHYAIACFFGTVYFLLHGVFEAPLFSYHVMSVLLLLLAYQVKNKV